MLITGTAVGIGFARWQGATFRWYSGADRSQPEHVEQIPAAEARATWSDSVVIAGEQPTVTWIVWSPFPFEIEMEFFYRAERDVQNKSAKLKTSCGPVSPTPHPELPSISELSAPANLTIVEPGDTVLAAYSAGNTGGLWVSQFVVSGPFDAEWNFDDNLRTSVSRGVPVVVPRGTTPAGGPTVTAFAIDPWGRFARRELALPPLSDMAPPSVASLAVLNPERTNYTNQVSGKHFHGDTITFQVTPTDNHARSSYDRPRRHSSRRRRSSNLANRGRTRCVARCRRPCSRPRRGSVCLEPLARMVSVRRSKRFLLPA